MYPVRLSLKIFKVKIKILKGHPNGSKANVQLYNNQGRHSKKMQGDVQKKMPTLKTNHALQLEWLQHQNEAAQTKF